MTAPSQSRLGTNPSHGTLNGTLTATVTNGIATFSGLTLDQAGIGYTLSATSGILTSPPSSPFNVTPASVSKLAVAIEPASVIAGAGFGLTIDAEDLTEIS